MPGPSLFLKLFLRAGLLPPVNDASRYLYTRHVVEFRTSDNDDYTFWSNQRDSSSPEPFDEIDQDGRGTSPVRNFEDEVLSEGDVLNLSQFDDPEEEDGEELFGDNLER